MAGEERNEQEEVDLQSDEAEMMARLQEEIRNLPVSAHLVYMLHSLSALAVGHLGLTAETAVRRDVAQARLAIDAFKSLVGVLEQVQPAGEIAVHRGMLSQLQLAYAGAMDRGAPAAEASETPPGAGGAPAESSEPRAESSELPAEGPGPEAPAENTEAPSATARPKPRKPRRGSRTGP